MKPQSAKNKGRRFQQAVATQIRAHFDLPEPDAVSTSMGKAGIDIQLSTAAREAFPYAVECKNSEKLNLWQALDQAKTNANKEQLKPLVCFTRNRDEAYVAMRMSDFFELVTK